MRNQLRDYLYHMNKIPSVHYVYLSSYPAVSVTELKELNILKWIKNPVIFVMRCEVSLNHVNELLLLGDGIMFDYEKRRLELASRIQTHIGKPFISPGIRTFIRPEIEKVKSAQRPLSYTVFPYPYSRSAPGIKRRTWSRMLLENCLAESPALKRN